MLKCVLLFLKFSDTVRRKNKCEKTELILQMTFLKMKRNKTVMGSPFFDRACSSPQDKNKWTIMSTLISVRVHFGQPNTGLDELKNRGEGSP